MEDAPLVTEPVISPPTRQRASPPLPRRTRNRRPTSATRPAPADPPSNFATIDGAISYAQQSGFSIINLFTAHTPLSEYRDAVGAEIIYLVLSHIGELDKNASVTVTGSAMDGALTLTISALTPEASVLGARRMGEIRALAESLNGTVEINEQVGAWSLTAHIPAAEDTPA